MDELDIGLLGAISREGMVKFYEQNLGSNMLLAHGRVVFKFMEEHWLEYQVLPSPETIRNETGVNILVGPVEPIEFWCKKIRERTLYENLLASLEEVSESLKSMDLEKTLRTLQAISFKHANDLDMKSDRPISVFENTAQRAEEYLKGKEGFTGIPTPWDTLNEATRGWQPGDFGLIAARPAVGKTWLLLVLARYAWKHGFKVLIASTEMSHRSLLRRIDSLHVGVSYKGIRDSSLSPEKEKIFLDKMYNPIKDDNLLIFGDGMNVSLSSIELAIIQQKPDLVCIDGIYLLKALTRFERSQDNIAEIFKQTKGLAKRMGVPILATTQINRENNKAADLLSRLAFSDAAGQMTDYVFVLEQDEAMKNSRELLIQPAKMREADYLKNIKIHWKFDVHNFDEIEDIEAKDKNEKKTKVMPKFFKTPPEPF